SWKASLLQVPGADVAPLLPAQCRIVGSQTSVADVESVTRTWTMTCDAPGLVGGAIGFRGLGDAKIDGLVRVRLADGRVLRGVVRAADPVLTIPAPQRPLDIARAYVRIGVTHILTGVDHLLFIAGLLLLARGRRSLVETIAAFTVGHSLALAL